MITRAHSFVQSCARHRFYLQLLVCSHGVYLENKQGIVRARYNCNNSIYRKHVILNSLKSSFRKAFNTWADRTCIISKPFEITLFVQLHDMTVGTKMNQKHSINENSLWNKNITIHCK